MLDIFNLPIPQSADYQEFYGGGTTRNWVKPRGASMARILIIGAGGGGASTRSGAGGGASGAITTWIGPAIFIPDVLRISIGAGGPANTNGTATSVIYMASSGTGYTLLTANGGNGTSTTTGGTAAAASSNNPFGAAGIFNSIAGQAGSSAGAGVSSSTTTFLSGGASGSSTSSGNGNGIGGGYGHPTLAGGLGPNGGNGNDGYFITQPIMYGRGGTGGGGRGTADLYSGNGGNGGIGCGGGGSGDPATIGRNGSGGRGGDGAAFIWAW